MPDDVQAIAERHGFNWGGTFPKPDPMHFEFLGTPADAARRTGAPAAVQPVRGGTPPPPRTYTVKAGDTLSAIGAQLGVKWRELAARNNIAGPKFIIRPGQVLFF
jgi:LysM repeat protein